MQQHVLRELCHLHWFSFFLSFKLFYYFEWEIQSNTFWACILSIDSVDSKHLCWQDVRFKQTHTKGKFCAWFYSHPLWQVVIPMKFTGESHVELRPPRNTEDLKAYTTLSLLLHRPKGRGDGKRRRRQDSVDTGDLFVLYLGKKDVSWSCFISFLLALIWGCVNMLSNGGPIGALNPFYTNHTYPVWCWGFWVCVKHCWALSLPGIQWLHWYGFEK